jgi:hypothetical protein
MSFDTMKVQELRDVAESFAVELPVKIAKQKLILLLEEEGITYDTYKRFFESERVEPEPDPSPRKQNLDVRAPGVVLVKMERGNMSYQYGDFVFTQQHPYVPMNENQAQTIFDNIEGFRLATPREVQEFYR